MPKSDKEAQVNPFVPHPFPPRHLKKHSFAHLLDPANEAMKQFGKTLRSVTCPQQIYSSLLTIEAIDSLESQEIEMTFKKFIQSDKESKTLPIYDYLEALDFACGDSIHTPFSRGQICRIHNRIKKNSAPIADRGRYRNRQNWIGPKGCSIHQAYFYPPKASQVTPLMDQLVKYMKKNEKEPLLQLALIFAQLLIIHPFMDGNGRIARILIPLFLYQKKVLPQPFFFLSSYFKFHRLKYFQTLYQTTEEEAWENWIHFFLKGIIYASRRYKQAIKQSSLLYEHLRVNLPHLSAKTCLFLFKHPIFPLDKFQGSVSDLEGLKRVGMIKQSRAKVLSFLPLLTILERFHKK
jgi:Fic family protein